MKLFRCEHGCFHLTIDNTTIHLSRSQVKTLATLMEHTVRRWGEVLDEGTNTQGLGRRFSFDNECN